MHCVAGVSRSATVCLGYLMSHEQLRYPEAWRVLQKARSVARFDDPVPVCSSCFLNCHIANVATLRVCVKC